MSTDRLPTVLGEAIEEHLNQIAEIAQCLQLRHGLPDRAGFLTSAYEREDYAHFLRNCQEFVVATRGNELIGFVITHSGAQIPRQHSAAFDWDLPFRGLVIAQVAVDPDLRHTGIGTLLYEEIFRRHAHEPIGAAIVEEPPNQASTNFHQRHGFRPIAGPRPGFNPPVGFWLRDPS